MFSEFRKQAAEAVRKALQKHNAELTVSFSVPALEEFGELSTNVCFQLSSQLKKTPGETASLLAKQIIPYGMIREVRAEKGYLNFYVNHQILAKKLIEKMGADFGGGEEKKEKIIVEHTSANPDGPLHIGHLRNAVVGDSLARILRFAGHTVEVHYYLNDMGKQTAKLVWGLRRFTLEDGKKDHATAKVYIEANRIIEEGGLEDELSEILLSYERGDKKTVAEFKRAVEFCLEGIKETLARLGIKHDRFIWESSFVRDGTVAWVISELAKTNYAIKENRALSIELGDFGISKDMVIMRSDGSTLYLARDLAHHLWKMKTGLGINVWGADHKLVSEHLKAGLTILGSSAPEFIIHEFISIPEGGMSTRKGVFISADQLMDKTVEKSYEELRSRRHELEESAAKKISEEVGISAVRFNIERIAPEKSMVFRWEEALDFERQGSPFIQYAYARAKKILLKSKAGKFKIEHELSDYEKRILIALSRFPETVLEAAKARKVSIMAGYAIELSNLFHSFYMSTRVLGAREESFRLALVEAVITVLGSAMDILGIKRLEEM
jgi:arginyl-tRNA synthetase